MKPLSGRLDANAPHGFGGSEIDRTKPLRFRLNGRTVAGFVGDTVLTALLGSGFDSIGVKDNIPLALDERFAPLVVGVAQHEGASPLPMARLLAQDGDELMTLDRAQSRHRPWDSLKDLRHRHSLGLVVTANDAALVAPLTAIKERRETDLVVVGGGLAGLSAARAAAEAGDRVILIERRTWLGGDAGYFGAVEEEEEPARLAAQLCRELGNHPDVLILRSTEAVAVHGLEVVTHRIANDGSFPRGHGEAIAAKRVILATGALERLPIFAGNRLPGVVRGVTAFHRAERYGLWRGKTALFAAQNNYIYRLALRAHDAGIGIERIIDSRLNPQSRFVDFAKAVGFTLASGLMVQSAAPLAKESARLGVSFAIGFKEIDRDAMLFAADQLLVSGGWQPDITLWTQMGGACHWNPAKRCLAAVGAIDNIMLAGSAAGYSSTRAVVQSGGAAFAALAGRVVPAIEDRLIGAAFETADGPTPIAPVPADGAPAYLDGSTGLTTRYSAPRQHWLRRNRLPPISETGAFGLSEIAARVQLKEITAADAEIVVRERSVAAPRFNPEAPSSERLDGPPEDAAIPPYLFGRFGPRPVLATIAVNDVQIFEVGALIFANGEVDDPFAAIGVIIAASPDGRAGGLALLAKMPNGSGQRLVVRDLRGPTPVTSVVRFSPSDAPK